MGRAHDDILQQLDKPRVLGAEAAQVGQWIGAAWTAGNTDRNCRLMGQVLMLDLKERLLQRRWGHAGIFRGDKDKTIGPGGDLA